MRAIANVYAVLGTESMLLQCFQLFEERWYVDDASASDEVLATGVYKTAGKDVEIVGDAIGDNGMAGIVSSLRSTAQG